MTDTHVPDVPAVAWEYTGRDWPAAVDPHARAIVCRFLDTSEGSLWLKAPDAR